MRWGDREESAADGGGHGQADGAEQNGDPAQAGCRWVGSGLPGAWRARVVSDGEQRGDGLASADAADGLAEQRGDADDADFLAAGLGNGVGGDDFLDGGVSQALVGEFSEDAVGDAGEDAFGAVFVEDLGGGGEGAGGFGHVVDEEDVAAFDLADDVHRFDAGGGDAVFGDDGEFGAEGVGVGAGHFDAADIG